MLFLPTSPFVGGQNEQESTLLFLYLLAWIVQRRNRPAPALGVVKKERLNRVGVVVACAAAADYHWCRDQPLALAVGSCWDRPSALAR
jgi:hypothetical protein